MIFELYNINLQDVKDYHLAIAPWIYDFIPVISATLLGTRPKVYEVVKTDDHLQQLLLNCYKRKENMKLWIITKEKPREESQQVSLVSSNITNLRRARAVAIKQVVVEPLYWTESSSMFRKRRRHLRSIRERGEQHIELSDDE